MYNYAYLLDNGDGIETNKIEASRYYKDAADNGHIMAIHYFRLASQSNLQEPK